MHELYSERERLVRKRIRLVSAGFAVLISLAALIYCIFCVSRVRTGNTRQMAERAIVCSTAAGWLVITLLRCVTRPAGREYRHAGMILAEQESELCEGVMTVLPEVLQIPASIRIRKVSVNDGANVRRVTVNARLAKRLPENGSAVRLRLKNGYITSWEVTE